MNEIIKGSVAKYYGDKIKKFGKTAKGVDWNSEASQSMRFQQLLKVIDTIDSEFSILDYGCGYGAMYEYMNKTYSKFNYTGFDIANEMIEAARGNIGEGKGLEWCTDLANKNQFDYVVASGIFNVKLQNSNEEWIKYVLDTLKTFNQVAEKGFSFNILTKYSDKEYMRDYLYYADPLFLFDYCKKHFSKQVALLHDYPIYEFSIIVRK